MGDNDQYQQYYQYNPSDANFYKYYDIHQIGKNVTDLHDLSKDVNILVHDQGQMTDNIEQNIQRAEYDTEKGTTELQIAKKHKESSRRIYCCLLTTLIIALIFIAAILAIHFGVFEK